MNAQVRNSIGSVVFAIVLAFTAAPVFTQSSEATPSSSPSASPTRTPVPDSAEPKAVDYFMPDLAPDVTTFRNKAFTMKVSFAVLGDYTFVGQNAASRSQVGPQASIFDLRAGRLMLVGTLNFKKPWNYQIAGDYDEHRNRGDRLLDILDFNLTIPLWKKARVTLGKQKEPFIFEMTAAATFLPHQERLLNAFFVSRNVGIKYQDNFLKNRMSFSAGVFNDWFQSDVRLSESGYQVSGRVTGLPIESRDHRTFLHLGLGLRYNGADKNTMRFKVRPETNVIDNYADTGNFPARYAKQLSLEALYNKHSFSVLGEYTQAWVKSAEKGNPSFNGSYVTVSYFLTGETRGYDKRAGNIAPIIPRSRWGAVEIVGRLGYVDLDDDLVKGGKLKTFYGGANWWASRQWKIGAGYGVADLDRFHVVGRTNRFMTRVQWIY